MVYEYGKNGIAIIHKCFYERTERQLKGGGIQNLISICKQGVVSRLKIDCY